MGTYQREREACGLPKHPPRSKPSVPDITVLEWNSPNTMPPADPDDDDNTSAIVMMLLRWGNERIIVPGYVQYKEALPHEGMKSITPRWRWSDSKHNDRLDMTTLLGWAHIPGLFI